MFLIKTSSKDSYRLKYLLTVLAIRLLRVKFGFDYYNLHIQILPVKKEQIFTFYLCSFNFGGYSGNGWITNFPLYLHCFLDLIDWIKFLSVYDRTLPNLEFLNFRLALFSYMVQIIQPSCKTLYEAGSNLFLHNTKSTLSLLQYGISMNFEKKRSTNLKQTFVGVSLNLNRSQIIAKHILFLELSRIYWKSCTFFCTNLCPKN